MLTTKRLIIQPLTYSQLVKYIQADHSLELELGLNNTERTISPALKDALENTILPNVANSKKNYLYGTLWTVIAKAENKMVGDLCFVDEPNEAGEVEIGYGTYEAFTGNGFMTEAVGAVIAWAKVQPKINSIVASTEKDNIASFTILQKNGFSKIDETAELFKWQLNIR